MAANPRVQIDRKLYDRAKTYCEENGGTVATVVHMALHDFLPSPSRPAAPAKPKHRTLKELATLPTTLVWNEKIFRRGIKRDHWNMFELHHLNPMQEASNLNSGRTEPFWTGLKLGRADEMGLDVWAAYEAGEAVPFNPVTHGYLLLSPMTDEQEKAIERANAA